MARKRGPRYGLTCGYWSNRPGDVDNHVLHEHHPGRGGEDVYDLMEDQYEGQPLRKCQAPIVEEIARNMSGFTPERWSELKSTSAPLVEGFRKQAWTALLTVRRIDKGTYTP